jgi:hypothetical protein
VQVPEKWQEIAKGDAILLTYNGKLEDVKSEDALTYLFRSQISEPRLNLELEPTC